MMRYIPNPQSQDGKRNSVVVKTLGLTSDVLHLVGDQPSSAAARAFGMSMTAMVP